MLERFRSAVPPDPDESLAYRLGYWTAVIWYSLTGGPKWT